MSACSCIANTALCICVPPPWPAHQANILPWASRLNRDMRVLPCQSTAGSHLPRTLWTNAKQQLQLSTKPLAAQNHCLRRGSGPAPAMRRRRPCAGAVAWAPLGLKTSKPFKAECCNLCHAHPCPRLAMVGLLQRLRAKPILCCRA